MPASTPARSINIHYIDSEKHRATTAPAASRAWTPSWCPGGFGKRGVEGKIAAIRYARENRVPYLGICLGHAARRDRVSRATWPAWRARTAPSSIRTRRIPVIALITEWHRPRRPRRAARRALRPRRHHAPGRAGVPRCCRAALARQIYGEERIVERHRHRYEVNNHYVPRLQQAGLRVSAACRCTPSD